jgi:hypothetical protein
LLAPPSAQAGAPGLDGTPEHQAILVLARESGLPFDQVAQLYEDERAQLDVDAHVKQFLPIFTLRSVRAKLLQRRPA